jgi:hypothetical protein
VALHEAPTKQLKEKYGFDADAKWLEHLQKSCVRISTGGSGSLVSPTGLVMTNHHVGSDMLEKLSTADNDLIEKGFYAQDAGRRGEVPRHRDATSSGRSRTSPSRCRGGDAGMSPRTPTRRRRKMMATIEQESKDATELKSEVVTLYQGGRYHLYRYKRYTDVRLVMAPEKGIAFFGGDPDNFEYPRYDLDMCFFRIYDNGAPLHPEHYLQWSKQGTTEGDLVFVAGHPGRTERLYTVAHLEFLRDVAYPLTMRNLWRREVQLANFSGRSEENRRIAEGRLLRHPEQPQGAHGRVRRVARSAPDDHQARCGEEAARGGRRQSRVQGAVGRRVGQDRRGGEDLRGVLRALPHALGAR